MLVGEEQFDSVLMYLPNDIAIDCELQHSSILPPEHVETMCFEPPSHLTNTEIFPIESLSRKNASQQNSLGLEDHADTYHSWSNAPQTVRDLAPNPSLSFHPEIHLSESSEPCSPTLTEMIRAKVEVALREYYRHSYQPYFVDSSSQRTKYSLLDDIKLASRIPNRLQESFQDRLVFLLNEHGFLITRDALLRPADKTDSTWQDMLHQTNITSNSEVPIVLEVKEEDDGNSDEELLIDEDKEEDTRTFRSVMAQGAGAYLFTTLIPVALGLPISLPMLSITACVGAVAGQVAWDSFQQQKLLYPLQYSYSSPLSAVSVSLSLNPPRYKPALREWRRAIFMALACSERGCTMQQHSIDFFAGHWLKQYLDNPTEFPFTIQSGTTCVSVGSASSPGRQTTEKVDEEGWEMLDSVAAQSSGCEGDNFV